MNYVCVGGSRRRIIMESDELLNGIYFPVILLMWMHLILIRLGPPPPSAVGGTEISSTQKVSSSIKSLLLLLNEFSTLQPPHGKEKSDNLNTRPTFMLVSMAHAMPCHGATSTWIKRQNQRPKAERKKHYIFHLLSFYRLRNGSITTYLDRV